MASDITAIIAGIATIEAGITAPSGQQSPIVLSGPPTATLGAPAFLNLEGTTDLDEYRALGVDGGELVHPIDVYLLMPPADPGNTLDYRRLWAPVVMDAFERDRTRLGGACIVCYVRNVTPVAVTYGNQDFAALRFRLNAIADRA